MNSCLFLRREKGYPDYPNGAILSNGHDPYNGIYIMNDLIGCVLAQSESSYRYLPCSPLRITKPCLTYDLPAGGKRLIQKSRGYDHTFVKGIEVSHNGEFTGQLPGKLIRGNQSIN